MLPQRGAAVAVPPAEPTQPSGGGKKRTNPVHQSQLPFAAQPQGVRAARANAADKPKPAGKCPSDWVRNQYTPSTRPGKGAEVEECLQCNHCLPPKGDRTGVVAGLRDSHHKHQQK